MWRAISSRFKLVTLVLCASAAAVSGQIEKAGWTDRVPDISRARPHFAAPDGRAENPGTQAAPWDLASALAGQRKLAPGDILWVRGGNYRGKFEVKLAGRKDAPIIIRAYPGERATILDSGMDVLPPTDYVWLWDLEIAGSVPMEKRQTQQRGSHPSDLPGRDGLTIQTGRECRFINLIIHDNVAGGVGWWRGSIDSEFHGCIICNNGWRAPDRGHGHCIYTQNEVGTKAVSNCIMTVPFDGSFTMHAYGSSRAFVDNYVIEDNIAFAKGPFLVGGGRPSHNIKVLRNYLHGINMIIGYGAQNEDCELRDNVIAKGTLSINKYKKVVDEGNIRQLSAARSVLIPNKYDPTRAHAAIYNGAKAAQVALDVSAFLKPGESFRLLPALDVFGKPVLEGTATGATLSIPSSGEFAAYVLIKSIPH